MLLKDKIVIVTGVGPGMGQHLGQLAAEEGASVALAARSAAFINDIAGKITAKGGKAIAVPTDVSDMAQCQRLVDETVKAFGRVDCLINSAYSHEAMIPLDEGMEIDQYIRSYNVTFLGAVRMAKAVIPVMRKNNGGKGKGSITNVSSQATQQVVWGEGDYAAAKAALNQNTKQLARELGRYNIRVNAALMGWLGGPAVDGFVKSAAAQQGVAEEVIVKGITKNIALGVIPPDSECAKAALFLASDYASMVSGAQLNVNGGEYM
jgi:NAD(P)-dependent dehydrogenase (short-subunit alcohol dehydrogenase family)